MSRSSEAAKVIPIADADRPRRGVRARPKGRAVDPQARADVRALLGDAPRRRDLLIEYLHQIQDRYGCISAAHVVALAREMQLAPTEVYEVATFYHHFDVVKEGETRARRAHGARVRFAVVRARRRHELLAQLRSRLGHACASSPRRASDAASRRRP